MKNERLFSNSIIYTVGNLLLKAISFFLIPLYTSYLTTEEYGTLNLAGGFYGLCCALVTLALPFGIVRYYTEYKNDREKVARMFGSVILFTCIVGAAFILACILFQNVLSGVFFGGIPFYPIVFLAVLISVEQGLYTIYQDILRGMQNAKRWMLISYINFFALLFCNILTIVVMHLGAKGAMLSTSFVYLVMILVMLVDLRHRKLLVMALDTGMLKELLRYSLPLLPHTIAFNVQSYATRVIINTKLSLSVLGLYSLASQFGNVSDVVLNSIQSAFQPWMFGVLNERPESGKQEMAKASYLLMWLYGLLFLLIGVFSQEAILIMAQESYATAWYYVPVIVFSIAVKSPLYFYTDFLYYEQDKTKYIFPSTLLGCVICIVFTWLLVGPMGIYGSILADIIAMLFRLGFIIYVTRQIARTVYSLKKIVVLSLVPMVFMVTALIPSWLVFSDSVRVLNILYKLLIVAVYMAVAVLVNRKDVLELAAQLRTKRR